MGHLTEQDVWTLVSGETAPPDRVTHVKNCHECRSRLEQAAGVRQMVRAAKAPDASPSSRVAGLERFERVMNLEQRRARRWLDRRPLLLPALGMAAAAGAAMAFMVGGNPSHPMAMTVPLGQQVPVAMTAQQLRPTLAPHALEAPAAPMMAAGNNAAGNNTAQPVVANTVPGSKRRGRNNNPVLPVMPEEPPVAPMPELAMAPSPLVEPNSNTVSVEAVYRFERVAALRELLRQGDAPAALQGAVALLTSEVPGEGDAALQVIREAALQQPSVDLVARVDSAAAEHRPQREALTYLACEAAVLGKRPQEAVERCRSFAGEFPSSSHARDASYVAGMLAQRELSDCAGAVEDYRKSLVFTGALGSLNDYAWLWRAQCLAELGRADEAAKDLKQFLARYPLRREDRQVVELQQKLRSR